MRQDYLISFHGLPLVSRSLPTIASSYHTFPVSCPPHSSFIHYISNRPSRAPAIHHTFTQKPNKKTLSRSSSSSSMIHTPDYGPTIFDQWTALTAATLPSFSWASVTHCCYCRWWCGARRRWPHRRKTTKEFRLTLLGTVLIHAARRRSTVTYWTLNCQDLPKNNKNKIRFKSSLRCNEFSFAWKIREKEKIK